MTPLIFDFEWDDPGLGKLLTEDVHLPSRPMVGDRILVVIESERGEVVIKAFVTEIMWRGMPAYDYREPCGTLTLKGSME